jgi:phosphoenolpyruvate synthase/pyruvate phosphate dikinase
MVWETRTRRGEADRLTEKFATSLTERRERAQRIRSLVNDCDMSPDLAAEVVDARMRRTRARQSPGYVRIVRRDTKLRIVIDLAKLNPQGETLIQLLVRKRGQ